MAKNKLKRTELVEIKKDNVGTGLLIEEDGFITIDKSKYITEGINGDGWNIPNPFVVDAVFQKFGIKNANGRIYPEKVLKEQVEKYQQLIADRRAMGECYTPEVKVMVKNGWKQISSLRKGEYVLTFNTSTMEYEYKKIIQVIKKEHDGKMIHIFGEDIDDIVTPGHKYPVFDRNEKNKMSFREHVEASVLKDTEGYIPLAFGWFSIQDCTFEETEYKGNVYCIDVENHTFLVESNGKQHWTSNCNHPAESTIDLSRVSHNIIELHWEGRTLVGKLELNTTEGFRKHGIVTSCGDQVANLLLNGYKIGVSSRGVGSVEQKLGQYIVGDDFELICWDIVSQPSTPNAYISLDGREGLQPYMESDTSNEKKNKLIEKLERAGKLLS